MKVTSTGPAKNWWAITSSADGTKLAATVSGGNIWTLDTTLTTQTPTTTMTSTSNTTTKTNSNELSFGSPSKRYCEMSSVAIVLTMMWVFTHYSIIYRTFY